MMTTLFAVSVLALAVLAVWFVAVLAIRLFTKRRPPLCTRFTVAVAVVAVSLGITVTIEPRTHPLMLLLTLM